jgi:hypothetical protein
MTIKTILGYDVVPGVTPEEYEKWLFEVHAPDLLANPYLDRIVFNKVLRPVERASGGTATVPDGYTFYRIAEMHSADEDAYANYLAWFEEHPLPAERGPGGRTDFRFYLVTESTEVTR